MGIGASIFLLAAGAILSWGVEADPEGVNVGTIGAILMVVGGLGLLMSLLLFEDWRPWGRRRDYVDDEPVVRRRDVYIDDEPYVRQSVVEEEPVVRRSVVEQDPVVRRRVVSSRRVTY